MKPKVYQKSEHGLSKQQIDPDALYVLETLQRQGYLAYLVGGSVRDLLLGHTPKDFDISTSAKPEEVKAIFRRCLLIGRRFRLAHVRFGTKVIEVATFRAGDNEQEGLILRDNTWGTEEQDVLRRDFTINGLLYNANDETIIDYVDGYRDIQKQLLQVIGPPHTRFRQDPVRMLRLIKFRARLGFTIEKEAMQALIDCRPEILKSSNARILEEIFRMLESGHAKTFFSFLADAGLLTHLLPALSSFIEHDELEEVYTFLEAIDTAVQNPPKERSVLLASLVFPFFQRHIHATSQSNKHPPHLGKIQEEAHRIIDLFFSPFFLLPRKIKSCLIAILTTQFRFTPLKKRLSCKIHIPSIPDFAAALSFFQLRETIEPGYHDVYQQWYSAFLSGTPSKPRRRRRRR